MCQTDMDAMMYKIEGEDLYLIGTSEHSMIGRFIDQIIPSDKLPQTLTSYSPASARRRVLMVSRNAACTASTSLRSRR